MESENNSDNSTSDTLSNIDDIDEIDEIENVRQYIDDIIDSHNNRLHICDNIIQQLDSIKERIDIENNIYVDYNGENNNLYNVLDNIHTQSLKNIENNGIMTFGEELLDLFMAQKFD